MTTKQAGRGPKRPRLLRIGVAALLILISLTGCLEQVQSPRSATGALSNFYLHLYAGELDDARAYMAPGLVEITPELNARIQSASIQLRRYEIEKQRGTEKDLANGQKEVTIPGRVRPRAEATPTGASQEADWVPTDILTATMIERGPGWRILDFQVKCCSTQP